MTAEIIQFVPRGVPRPWVAEIVMGPHSNCIFWSRRPKMNNWNFDAETNTWHERSAGHPWPGEDKA